MKVNPQHFVRVLELASAKYEIDPVTLNFTEEGVVFNRVNAPETMLAVGKVKTTLFKDYQPIGEVTLDSKTIKKLKKMFKADDYIEIRKSGNEIIFEGAKEQFVVPMTVSVLKPVDTSVIEQTPYGIVLKKPKPLRAVKIDITELDIEYEDVIVIDYSENILKVESTVAGSKYVKKIAPASIVDLGDYHSKPKVMLDGETLESIVDALKDVVWIVFTEGPVSISYSSNTLALELTYIVSERVVT